MLRALAMCAILCSPALAQNIVVNGGFENGPLGWGDGPVVDSSVWQPAEGEHSLNLGTGAASQRVPAQQNTEYGIRFQMAGDPTVGPVVKSLYLEYGIDNPPTYLFTFDTTGHSRQSMGWQIRSRAIFEGTQSPGITFIGLTAGTAIDDVRMYPIMPGDANGDGTVDFADLLIVAQHYDTNQDWSGGDFNGDTFVAFDDLLLVAQHYGQSVNAPAVSMVPEPAALGLLMLAGIWWWRRRLFDNSDGRETPGGRVPRREGRGGQDRPGSYPETHARTKALVVSRLVESRDATPLATRPGGSRRPVF